MAATGASWGAWGYADYSSGTTFNDVTINDNATQTSDAIDLTGKAGCEVGIKSVGGSGTVDGVLTISVLYATGDDGGGTEEFEDTSYGQPWSFTHEPTDDQTSRVAFFIDPVLHRKFKVHLNNTSGITLTNTVEYRTAVMPAAS